MRKRIIQQIQPDASLPGEDDWLKLEDLADVEVTSENTAHPIESIATQSRHGMAGRSAGKADCPPYLHPSATGAADPDEFPRVRY